MSRRLCRFKIFSLNSKMLKTETRLFLEQSVGADISKLDDDIEKSEPHRALPIRIKSVGAFKSTLKTNAQYQLLFVVENKAILYPSVLRLLRRYSP